MKKLKGNKIEILREIFRKVRKKFHETRKPFGFKEDFVKNLMKM